MERLGVLSWQILKLVIFENVVVNYKVRLLNINLDSD